EILRGKHLQDGTVTPHDWLHFVISLLCHDIGYVKGICQHDDPGDRRYAVGVGDDLVQLPAGATDASLTPYHVDRGQRFIEENFANQHLIDIEQIKQNIELTRFPAPSAAPYQDTASYAGLTRAADLIGQLSDPRYLQKIPALFYEFEETGATQALGYRHPDDLRAGYPRFYNTVVLPYVKDGLRHLSATHEGRQILAYLHTNLMDAERPAAVSAAA
ncbi:MAG TPA: metal-dependent phosphohydrolase, partial [Chroococcidiopsis sp.]